MEISMLILHAALENGKVLIWAEKRFSDLPIIAKPKKKQVNPPPKTHPFAAQPELILDALRDLNIEKNNFVKSLVWLPSLEFAPLPSNPVLGECPGTPESLLLSPWAIWSFPLEYHQTLKLILLAANKDVLAPGVILGKSFAYIYQVVLFILSLGTRQRYLPSIALNESGLESLWSPVFLGPDKSRLCQLETAMPSVCRSLTTSIKQLEAPQTNPTHCLNLFISHLLDYVIRSTYENFKGKTKKSVNTHDCWLSSLFSKNNAMKISSQDGNTLLNTIQEWHQPIKNSVSSPFKFCLRLEEPEETIQVKAGLSTANSPWNISYLLQAYDDPSLIVTTKDVWNPKGAKRRVLERPQFNPRQFVLTSLGMATDICPHIESSLHEAIPKGFSLDSAAAFSFLQDQTPRLEDAGFGVICPNWWKKDKLKLSAKAFVDSPFKTRRNQSIWEALNTDWKIYLGDLGLSLEELYQLALLKDPIIKMRGEWVLLSKEDIQHAIQFLEKKPFDPKSALDFLKIAAGIPKNIHGIAIDGIEATGWVSEFLEALSNNSFLQTLEPPNGFKGSLRPYQLRGYSWMAFLQQWQLGACLADDMGLGKTPQTLAMLMRKWEDNEKTKPALLICPTSLLGNWSREAAKFVPDLPVHVHYGLERKKGDAFFDQIHETGLVITSYALLLRDEELFQKIRWGGIILDEAQNIKNAQTKQTKATHSLQGDFRLALTGTPVENNVGDLWSIMHFLNPGYLGSHDKFKQSFFNPIQIEKDNNATDTLKKLTKPLILRRLKTDRSIISDLPDKIEMKIYCTLTPEQISLYETVVADANNALETSEGMERKGIILATLTKLKQICNHPTNFFNDRSALHERSGKLSRLQEMLEEIHSVGDRCLIFTQYTEMGSLLKQYIEEQKGKEVLFLHGGTSKKQRDQMVERFQNENAGPSVFILSLKAGGVGLNLTRACHVFHFDRWWNPAIENQATDRAFRIGQSKNVQVHKFICTGTIEERIDEMIENKKEIAENVVGTGEGWLTELSTDSLKELWKLQKATC